MKKTHGTTNIPNGILDKLCGSSLSGAEMKILLFIIRKTYGWHKSQDRISFSQISAQTGLTRRTVIKLINRLVSKRTLVIGKSNNPTDVNSYQINSDFSQWESDQKQSAGQLIASVQMDTTLVSKRTLALVSKRTPTKETIKINTTNVVLGDPPKKPDIPKKKENTDITELVQYFKDQFSLPALDGSVKMNRYAAANLLRKFHGLENCRKLIQVARADPFWSTKVTSLMTLQRHGIAILNTTRAKGPGLIDVSGGS